MLEETPDPVITVVYETEIDAKGDLVFSRFCYIFSRMRLIIIFSSTVVKRHIPEQMDWQKWSNKMTFVKLRIKFFVDDNLKPK